MITLAALNALPQEEFIHTLGDVFEHSPWVAACALRSRPFHSRLQLLDVMRTVVAEAGLETQLSLIRAHPQLRARPDGGMSASSASEQRSAGLAGSSVRHAEQLEQLNAAYTARFAFPFVLAVRGHTPASILAAMEARLANDKAQERETCLREIGRIAAYRLHERVSSPISAEVIAMLGKLSDDPLAPTAPASPCCGTATAPAGLVREWMHLAGMAVHMGAGGYVVGRTSIARERTAVLIAGLYYDAGTHEAACGCRMDSLLVIAALQQLTQQRISPACDVAVIARPQGPRDPDAAGRLYIDESPSYVTLRQLDKTGADSEAHEALLTLRSAGVPDCGLVSMRWPGRHREWRTDSFPDADTLEWASSLWMRRLLDPLSGSEQQVFTHE